MVKIVAIDKDGNAYGKEKIVSKEYWRRLQKFGKHLRWKEIKRELYTKKENDGNRRKKRSGSGFAVEKA